MDSETGSKAIFDCATPLRTLQNKANEFSALTKQAYCDDLFYKWKCKQQQQQGRKR